VNGRVVAAINKAREPGWYPGLCREHANQRQPRAVLARPRLAGALPLTRLYVAPGCSTRSDGSGWAKLPALKVRERGEPPLDLPAQASEPGDGVRARCAQRELGQVGLNPSGRPRAGSGCRRRSAPCSAAGSAVSRPGAKPSSAWRAGGPNRRPIPVDSQWTRPGFCGGAKALGSDRTTRPAARHPHATDLRCGNAATSVRVCADYATVAET
jgi:hypothetical protein